jgi:hypothetical protein
MRQKQVHKRVFANEEGKRHFTWILYTELRQSCVSPQAQLQLEAARHDVVWMGSERSYVCGSPNHENELRARGRFLQF